ncbi:MAG: single-stranded DNA-binding protein [Anaerolineaceae bacterium]|jgi:single-strand DNA-binding protein|nr:single-stranded DNA-binding protein [Anaerolineaceae bacterium]
MPNLNRVQIIGRLGKDPEARTTKNGAAVVSFPVAVDRLWKNRDGESRKETDWFTVEAWGKLGQICQKFLGKGRLVFVEGRLLTQRWEQEGEIRYFTKVIAGSMQMLDRPKEVEEHEAETPHEEALDEAEEE